MTRAHLLVADVGGTNTRLGLAGPEGLQLGSLRRYVNDDHGCFHSLTQTYLSQQNISQCDAACVAVAAPVEEGVVKLTNRDWRIDKPEIRKTTGANQIRIMNDFEALGFSLDQLSDNKITHVAGPKTSGAQAGVRLVLGAGTGFNAAVFNRSRSGHRTVLAAECGHMTLPIETAQELSLRDHLAQHRGRASVERALSGHGVREIYEWVCAEAKVRPLSYSAPEIVALAHSGEDAHCVATIEMQVRLLARMAGDLVLAYLPTGGLFLSGGVTRACADLIAGDRFWATFTAKGRQSNLMRSIPIYLLNDDNAALEGCVSAMAQHVCDA